MKITKDAVNRLVKGLSGYLSVRMWCYLERIRLCFLKDESPVNSRDTKDFLYTEKWV